MKYHTPQNGQSLIVLVLMIAIVLAVVSAASYRLTTQTQNSVLQEDTVRALAAADTGVEFGLKLANNQPIGLQTFESLGINLPGIDAAKSKVTVTNASNQFVTPLIQKDQQFTFHVEDYANPQPGNQINTLFIHFLSGNTCDAARTQAAYEISYMYIDASNRSQVKRALVEPCVGQPGAVTTSDNANFATIETAGPYTVDTTDFPIRLTVDLAAEGLTNLQMVIVRPLFNSATLAFTGDPAAGLLSQGKEIRSEAYSISGASKVIQVYQSLPQIPAEFFVTTF